MIVLNGDTGITTPSYGGAVTAEYLVPVTGFKNKLINAQGNINQRGYVSGTATTGANQYTVDRFRVVTSGQNLSWTTSANINTFTAPAGGVEQVIEGLNLNTATYVLSWVGTATATVGGTSVSNGGSIAVTGGSNLTIRFSSGTFSLPQFEVGTTATSFDYRSYGTELQLCQRYYWRISGDGTGTPFCNIGCDSTTKAYGELPFPIQMRSAPTMSTSGTASHYQIRPWGGSGQNCSAVPAAVSPSTLSTLVDCTVASGLTTGYAGVLRDTSTSAFLGFSAEL